MSRNLVLRDDGLLGNLDARSFGLPDWLLLQAVSLMRGPLNEQLSFNCQLMGRPPETTHFAHRWRRPATWGFANGARATRVDSLTIAAGGLQAKGRLSFKTGVFGAIELPKVVRRVFWDKNKNSAP